MDSITEFIAPGTPMEGFDRGEAVNNTTSQTNGDDSTTVLGRLCRQVHDGDTVNVICEDADKPTKKVDASMQQEKKHQDPPARERPQDGQAWPERDSLSFTRSLVFYGAGAVTSEHEQACRFVQEARALREKYFGQAYLQDESAFRTDDLEYSFGDNGILQLFHKDNKTENLCKVPTIDEFVPDYNRLVEVCSSGAMRSYCFQRLQMLSSAFKMHITANGAVENREQMNLLGTDFYRTMKVDNHIHCAAAASAKMFVDFVRNKLESEGETVVLEDGKTLQQVFTDAGLDCEHMTIDAFNVLADYSVYQRFDNFNNKYSPFQMAQMRRIFLKVDNVIKGRYFAELTKAVLNRHEKSKGHNSAAELRLSIYGMERREWKQLAIWVMTDWKGGDFPGPVLSSHNRWLIQVPRLWRIYHRKKENPSFQDMLENLFIPMIEATLDPEGHPEVASFLEHVVGFDSVDDEGLPEEPSSCVRPGAWREEKNPAYSWQLYHLWANLEVINRLRKLKGLNTFSFRPHAGETGDVMHLASAYMLCRSINHGINLDRQVSLQYLYYLDQVGLSISPLSNNFLFRKITNNPFPKLFTRGLNVTLSTDDPLLFHMSDDALLEEYSVARASFDLSMTDVSEIARNSILQSGFEDELKKKWIGENYERGVTFCDEHKTHVPLIRAKFRAEHLAIEHMLATLIAEGKGNSVLREMMVQFGLARDAHRNILLENFSEVPQFPYHNQI
eukprot:CAMPEP_0118702700 /NCGR_PEP_ID=MMETSP0800-20121206/18057_1 /TAXON_ID=210618 ORGANISM="Striatella unipunctata, Strain CCMP2910" /NCGR_SAMPLE_ID=MMETSP0800 /ASSEMBLY_ACC=CAM_ASM_000638 /LENGTH=728 /DNA_ID=CAMNT_0006603971 /DNA_START=63 /DNA_END=2249 /DNA_ORIENTATION=-